MLIFALSASQSSILPVYLVLSLRQCQWHRGVRPKTCSPFFSLNSHLFPPCMRLLLKSVLYISIAALTSDLSPVYRLEFHLIKLYY